VLYMGVKTLPAIASALIEGGMPAEIPAAAVQWGTLPRQRTVAATLGTLAERAAAEGIVAPVITVIGWSAVLRDEINWFERRPLFGKRIVVTRAAQQSQALSDKLMELGAEVIEMPSTRIARMDLSPLREEIARIGDYQWLIFTSQNAVAIFWEQLLGTGRDARALASLAIAAVGPATAGALLERGIAVDVIPERFVAEGLLEKLTDRDDVSGARVLYVTAEGSREVLIEGLDERGAEVTVIHAYRSVQDGAGAGRLRKALESGSVNAVTFTSASAVRGYVDAVGEDLSLRAPAVTIGPQTTEASNAAGIELLAEAEEATIDGVVAAVERSLA
jgi:uroporphyrinogen III methyltransferase/synthase